MPQISNLHLPTPSRHPGLDTGLGFSLRGGAKGSQTPDQAAESHRSPCAGDGVNVWAGVWAKLLTLVTLLLAAPALAADPPRAVARYTDCVRLAFLNPGEETSDTFETALDLAKAQCGNLRPAAVEVLKRTTTRTMTEGGDTPESAAQALLDIVVLEQAAGIWAETHPNEPYHGR
jgi:hypothetical protein